MSDDQTAESVMESLKLIIQSQKILSELHKNQRRLERLITDLRETVDE